MPLGAAVSEGSSGDNIQHVAAIRLRTVGRGQLYMQVSCLGTERTKVLVPLTLKQVNRIVPTRLVNFVETRVYFEIKTTELDAYMYIGRIVVYMKEIYTSHPGS